MYCRYSKWVSIEVELRISLQGGEPLNGTEVGEEESTILDWIQGITMNL